MPTTRLQVIRQSGDDVILVRKCPMCGKEVRRAVNAKMFDEGCYAREHGALIQRAFPEPYFSDSDRELIITGICDDCWL